MKFFVERIETDQTIQIVLKPHSLYLMLLMLGGWLLNDLVMQSAPIAQVIMPVFIVFMVIRFFALLRIQKEVLVAMKQNKVATTGSKFSFANPFTYTINK